MNTVSDIEIYTDGSFDVRSSTGGWAFVVYQAGHEIYRDYGVASGGSNNSLELLAVLKAAIWINAQPSGEIVTVWTDSKHVVEGCRDWLPIWKNNGWRRIDPNPHNRKRKIPDAEAWKLLDAELAAHSHMRIMWCMGHEGLAGNEQADSLANAARTNSPG